MATYNTLTSLLTAIANAIRTKTGDSASINAQDFPNKIENISSVPKTQTVSQVISLKAYSTDDFTFTFDTLTTVYGVSSILKEKTEDNSYGQYMELGQRNFAPVNYIKAITGNTVTLNIWAQVDTSAKAKITVTAIGQ